MLGGNERRPPEERRISERGTKGRFFLLQADLGFFSPFICQWSHWALNNVLPGCNRSRDGLIDKKQTRLCALWLK